MGIDKQSVVTVQLRMLFQDEALQGCSRDVQDDALVTTKHRWRIDDICDKKDQTELPPMNCYCHRFLW